MVSSARLGVVLALALFAPAAPAAGDVTRSDRTRDVRVKGLTKAERAALDIGRVRVVSAPGGVLVTIDLKGDFGRRAGRGHLKKASAALLIRPRKAGAKPIVVATSGKRGTTLPAVAVVEGRRVTFVVPGTGDIRTLDAVTHAGRPARKARSSQEQESFFSLLYKAITGKLYRSSIEVEGDRAAAGPVRVDPPPPCSPPSRPRWEDTTLPLGERLTDLMNDPKTSTGQRIALRRRLAELQGTEEYFRTNCYLTGNPIPSPTPGPEPTVIDDGTPTPTPAPTPVPGCPEGATGCFSGGACVNDAVCFESGPGCPESAEYCYVKGNCPEGQTCTGTGNSPGCSDGIDRDGDGLLDYPADYGCTNPEDDTEDTPFQCNATAGLGGDGRIEISGSCSGHLTFIRYAPFGSDQWNGAIDIQHVPPGGCNFSGPTGPVECNTKPPDPQNPSHLFSGQFTTSPAATSGSKIDVDACTGPSNSVCVALTPQIP